jgi:TonB family protein
MDRTLRNCFRVSAAIGVLVLIAIWVVPAPPPTPTTVDDLPERIARLILEKPKPVAPPSVKAPERITVEQPPEVAKPKPPPRRRTSKPTVAKDKGVEGRQKAQQEVTQNLAQVTGSLDKVLSDLSESLPASEKGATDKPKPRRRRRGVRSGRSSQQLSSVNDVASLSSADVSKSAIESEGISIAAITDLTVSEGAGGDVTNPGGSSGRGSASSGGEYRTNEDLLSTVRRYAPGIQFCYDNELKKNPDLRGKLVVSITVLASGQVSEAFVVADNLGSPAVTTCVLSQIRGWQFPQIPQGQTSFKTPFVFTPPD